MADFSAALRDVKNGKRATRKGWNGKGMYVTMQVVAAPGKPYLSLHTATGDDVPWTASQTDLLADDWTEHKAEPKRLYGAYPLSVQALHGSNAPYEQVLAQAIDYVLRDYFDRKGDPERFKIEIKKQSTAWMLDNVELHLEGWSRP